MLDHLHRHSCALVATFPIALFAGCSSAPDADVVATYSSRELSARIVDQMTGAPIEGAVVAASWQLEGWEGYPVEQLAAREAVTDRDGRFRMEAWGPLTRNKGHMKNLEPSLWILHEGHWPLMLNNAPDDESLGHLVRGAIKFRFQDKSISLRPVTQQVDPQYLVSIRTLAHLSQSAFSVSSPCYWRTIPRLVVVLDRIKASVDPNGSDQYLPGVPRIEQIAGPMQCGDALQYLREYM